MPSLDQHCQPWTKWVSQAAWGHHSSAVPLQFAKHAGWRPDANHYSNDVTMRKWGGGSKSSSIWSTTMRSCWVLASSEILYSYITAFYASSKFYMQLTLLDQLVANFVNVFIGLNSFIWLYILYENSVAVSVNLVTTFWLL